MKRFLFALAGVAILATSAWGQVAFQTTLGEYIVPFRSTGASLGMPLYGANGAQLTTYSDTSYTSRGGAAWGATVLSQTDTTVWLSLTDLPDWIMSGMRSAAAVGDSINAFEFIFAPDPSNTAAGLVAGADSIYVTFQCSNDGGANIASATREDQVVNPTSTNGFTRPYNTQTNLALFKSASVTPSNFLQFKQFRWIISSDINGRYVLALRYPKFKR